MGTDSPRAPLDQSKITAALSRYWRVSVVDLTPSTQDDLLKKIASGDANCGDVILANYQSAGRGRLGRSFIAPESTALLFSLYLTPHRNRDFWGFIPLLAGLSIANTLRKIGADLSIKWPNDLLINDRKVGGIISTAAGDGVVVGIGINVSNTARELPVDHATSLAIAGLTQLDRNFLLPLLLNTLEKDFVLWDNGESLLDRYTKICATIGQEISIEQPGGHTIQSRALRIDELGQLHLENGDHVSVGDVIHLR
ncbi:MAG: biotin--[acetyl-CoA-carboxylase] ligase [Candidatus Planktophila sp.]